LRKPTSGSITLPDQKASGSVVFLNLTSEGIEIPSGTGIRPSGESEIRFVTTESVELPDRKGSEAEVQIEAATSGSAGNLPAGSIDAVEGSLGLLVAVVNPEPTSGGTEAIYTAVSIIDQIELERDLTSQLIEQAKAMLLEDLAPNQILHPKSVQTSQIIERSYDREVGDPAETIALSMVIEIEGAVYTVEDMETAARLALEKDLEFGQSSIPNTLVLESDETGDKSESVSFQLRATQEIFEIIDLGKIQWDLRGKSLEDANSYLSSRLDLTSDPIILLSPNWFPRLPWIGMRISIVYTWEFER
jgi:hypothetical protein